MTYTLPTKRYPNGAIGAYLTDELAEIFAALYPVKMNCDLQKIFGISTHTINKFKKQLGLKKNREAILAEHARQVKEICEANGYYQSMRGRRMNENCLKAAAAKRSSGWTPLGSIKEKDPERFKEINKRRRDTRIATFERERKHVKWGLDQTTKFHIPDEPYNGKEVSRRYKAHKKGYILGSPREFSGERYVFFYTDETMRSPMFERNSENAGFKIMPYGHAL